MTAISKQYICKKYTVHLKHTKFKIMVHAQHVMTMNITINNYINIILSLSLNNKDTF